MAKKIRDHIKDKRKAIYNALDRIDRHLFDIQMLAGENTEPTSTIVSQSLVAVEYARQALRSMLSNL